MLTSVIKYPNFGQEKSTLVFSSELLSKKRRQTVNNVPSSYEKYNRQEKQQKQKNPRIYKRSSYFPIKQYQINTKNHLNLNSNIKKTPQSNIKSTNLIKKKQRFHSLAALNLDPQFDQTKTPKKEKINYFIKTEHDKKINSINQIVSMNMETPNKLWLKNRNQEPLIHSILTANKNIHNNIKEKQLRSVKKSKFPHVSFSSSINNFKSSKKLLRIEQNDHTIDEINKIKKLSEKCSKNSDNFYDVYYNEQGFKKSTDRTNQIKIIKKLNFNQINQLNQQPYSQKSSRTLKIIRNNHSQTSRKANDQINLNTLNSQLSLKHLQLSHELNKKQASNQQDCYSNKKHQKKVFTSSTSSQNQQLPKKLTEIYAKCSIMFGNYQKRISELQEQNQKLKLQNQHLKSRINSNQTQ